MAGKTEFDRCPKAYLEWAFVVAGMVAWFAIYIIYTNMTGSVDYFAATEQNYAAAAADNLILAEHVNEEDDYEKPVCKRLEESGERY